MFHFGHTAVKSNPKYYAKVLGHLGHAVDAKTEQVSQCLQAMHAAMYTHVQQLTPFPHPSPGCVFVLLAGVVVCMGSG